MPLKFIRPFGTRGFGDRSMLVGWALPPEQRTFGTRKTAPTAKPTFKQVMASRHTSCTSEVVDLELRRMSVGELEANLAVAMRFKADVRPVVQQAAVDLAALLEAELQHR